MGVAGFEVRAFGVRAFALVLDGIVGRIEKRLMKCQPRQGETEKI